MENGKNIEQAFHVEEAFLELEQIIKQLEGEEVSLKDSIALYSKGATLITKCKEELNGIEKEMIIIGETI